MPPARSSLALPLPLLLFFVSGATGLLFEVLWLTGLGRVFGATAEAAAATLTAFFAGLGIGAFVWGRLASRLRRPLRAYGLLEVGVAVTAALGLLLETLHRALYGAVTDAVGTEGALLTVARFGLAFLVVGPPAFFMGGTLPVLGEHVVRDRLVLGRRGSLLYATNTAGAVLGCVAGAFWLPPWLGYRASYVGAMGAALLVGLAAVVLAHPSTKRRVGQGAAPASRPPGSSLAPAVLAFASGSLAIALQVLWTRLFAQVLQNSVQVFAAVLAVYLLALALGGALAHALSRTRWRPLPTLGLLLSGAALAVLVAGWVFATTLEGGTDAEGLDWAAYLLHVVLALAAVLLPPVIVLGAVFPYLMRVVQGAERGAGRALGVLVGWNTLGAAVGAGAAGFVLLPLLGLQTSFRTVALTYAVAGAVVALASRSRAARAAAWVVVVAAGVALLSGPSQPAPQPGERLLAAWEDPSGAVSVVERDGARKLKFNRSFTLGGSEDTRWETLQTRVALLPHPAPRRVFFLGMGTGITAGAALDHPVDHLVVAELVPAVVEAARGFFRPETNGLFDGGGRVTIVAADGRHRLAWGRETYDVVVGDLFFPWEPGAADLYTVEHFEDVRARLAPGGAFVQWLPCYQLSETEFLAIAGAMLEVFPSLTVWRGDFASKRPILGLAGREEGSVLDPDLVVANARALPPHDASELRDLPTSLPFMLYAGNLSAAPELLAGVLRHTTDRPWITWDAPRQERHRAAGRATAFVGDTLLGFEERLAAAVPPGEDPYLVGLRPTERRRVRGGLALRRIAVHAAAARWAEQRDALHDLVRLVPAAERPRLEAWVE